MSQESPVNRAVAAKDSLPNRNAERTACSTPPTTPAPKLATTDSRSNTSIFLMSQRQPVRGSTWPHTSPRTIQKGSLPGSPGTPAQVFSRLTPPFRTGENTRISRVSFTRQKCIWFRTFRRSAAGWHPTPIKNKSRSVERLFPQGQRQTYSDFAERKERYNRQSERQRHRSDAGAYFASPQFYPQGRAILSA